MLAVGQYRTLANKYATITSATRTNFSDKNWASLRVALTTELISIWEHVDRQ